MEDNLKFQEELSGYDRPPTLEDYTYRQRQSKEFTCKIEPMLNDEDMLCFHGTNIAAAKHIIESASISSGGSRLGYHTSFDPKGAFSVTNKNMVETSVHDYMNLMSNFYQPAGCLFVVRAKDKEEYERAGTAMLIKDVDFNKNPDRLVAVVTTPENVETMAKLARENHIDASKVMTFEGFIKHCQQNKNHLQMTNVNDSQNS